MEGCCRLVSTPATALQACPEFVLKISTAFEFYTMNVSRGHETTEAFCEVTLKQTVKNATNTNIKIGVKIGIETWAKTNSLPKTLI